jgi:hypothetical protein
MLMERRTAVRYPIALNAHYKGSRKNSIAGTGKIVNMSSRGLWMVSEQSIPVGSKLEVTVEWPALLDGSIDLVLVTTGRVVRTHQSGFALVLARYEFRTAKRKFRSAAMAAVQFAATAGGSPGTSARATAAARLRIPG